MSKILLSGPIQGTSLEKLRTNQEVYSCSKREPDGTNVLCNRHMLGNLTAIIYSSLEKFSVVARMLRSILPSHDDVRFPRVFLRLRAQPNRAVTLSSPFRILQHCLIVKTYSQENIG